MFATGMYFLIKGKIMEDLQDVGKHQTRNKDSQYIISRREDRCDINNLVGNGSNAQVAWETFLNCYIQIFIHFVPIDMFTGTLFSCFDTWVIFI